LQKFQNTRLANKPRNPAKTGIAKMTAREIGATLDLPETQVSKIHASIIARLKMADVSEKTIREELVHV
jgi:hypothetical protein